MKTLALSALLLIACNQATTPEVDQPVKARHPKACIETYPAITDTLIKGLEKYSLQVSSGNYNKSRTRCNVEPDGYFIECKGRSPDTLYIIELDSYCPATLRLKKELGGN